MTNASTDPSATSVLVILGLFVAIGVLLWLNAKWRDWINRKK